MNHIKNKRGQSTVEYVLLVTAVVAVIIAFVTGNKGSFQSQMNTTLNTATADIGVVGEQLQTSHVAQGKVGNGTPAYTVPVCGGAGQPACK